MEREYKIIIKADNVTDNKRQPIAQQEEATAESVKKTIGAVAVYQKAKQVIGSEITYKISTISLRTGQAEAQQRAEFLYNIGQKTWNMAENIAVGFAVGNIAGAVVGAVTSMVSTLQNYLHAANTISLQKAEESISLLMRQERAGVANNGNR